MTPPESPYAELDAVEDRLLSASKEESPAAAEQAASALGDAWVDALGARWAGERVTGFPRLGRTRVSPLAEVSTVQRLRSPGRLRDVAEAYDIALRERRLAWLLENADAALAALRSDVSEATGAPAPTDDAAFVEALQQTLASLIASNAPRERRRAVRERAVLFLGERLRAEAGGEWTVCDDPKDVHLGAFTIAGWSPIAVVRNVGPARPEGFLASAVQLEHEARRS